MLEWIAHLSSKAGSFFSSSEFLVPFLAALFASLTIIYVNFVNRRIVENKKRLYAVTYIADVSYRIAASTLVLRKHTLSPHLQAAEQMLLGDDELLLQCFEADDFYVATDSPMTFNALPEEQKILIGLDDIDLLQSFEAIVYMHADNGRSRDLNSFVREELSSDRDFFSRSEDERLDTLQRYQNLLARLDHHVSRMLWFVRYIVMPYSHRYVGRSQFFMYPKRTVKGKLRQLAAALASYSEFVPDENYMSRKKNQGVQQALNRENT
jgi:hypothetical protein